MRLLAGLRYLGHSFNPVSFYYCFDRAGERVEAVVAEVENIPWGERHAYVLARGGARAGAERTSSTRRLHVSPLMGMDQTYDLRAPSPGERLRPHRVADLGTGHGRAFDATLSLRRRELAARC